MSLARCPPAPAMTPGRKTKGFQHSLLCFKGLKMRESWNFYCLSEYGVMKFIKCMMLPVSLVHL